MERACSKCEWFFKADTGELASRSGFCRYLPPTPVVMPGQDPFGRQTLVVRGQ